jgi:hypothetical protein
VARPRPNDDVRLLAADGDVGVRGVRDAQQGVVELCLDRCEIASSASMRPAFAADAAFSSVTSCPLGSAPARITSPMRRLCLVPLRLQRIGLRDERAAALVELDGAIDDGGILALVGGRELQPIGILADALQPDAHARHPGARGLAKTVEDERPIQRGEQPVPLVAPTVARGMRGRGRRTPCPPAVRDHWRGEDRGLDGLAIPLRGFAGTRQCGEVLALRVVASDARSGRPSRWTERRAVSGA